MTHIHLKNTKHQLNKTTFYLGKCLMQTIVQSSPCIWVHQNDTCITLSQVEAVGGDWLARKTLNLQHFLREVKLIAYVYLLHLSDILV